MKTRFKPSRKSLLLSLVLLTGLIFLTTGFTSEAAVENANVYGTIWALIPPVVAIILALITKEVYSSLFIGIVFGALLYADWNPIKALVHVIELITAEIGANGGIIIFLVTIGIIVAMMQVTGCSSAYGNWASRKIKNKTGALISTTFMGLAFFIDDYFNCLTTGNVMRPVTDKFKVSRARLAYNIDCTAAPICIIAPISSWAAAVSSYIPEESGLNGFTIFVQAIPYNYYALLTIVMLFTLALLKFDFGPMKKYEDMAEINGDIYGGTGDLYAHAEVPVENPKGKVIDMFVPIISLIISCVVGLLYTGGFFEGATIIEAFSNTDAFMALAIGGTIALFVTIIYYFLRRIITMKEFTEAIPNGTTLMVPAMLILTFSWALSTVCRTSLGATEYVQVAMETATFNMNFLPVILYVLATFISFATGTAWGTFGILIPITVAIFGYEMTPLALVSISACLAGSVTGDHCSPISETAIMSSTAARVDFMMHVITQLPYAIFVAGFSAIGFFIAGFIQNPWICLAIMIPLMVGTLWGIKLFTQKNKSGAPEAEKMA